MSTKDLMDALGMPAETKSSADILMFLMVLQMALQKWRAASAREESSTTETVTAKTRMGKDSNISLIQTEMAVNGMQESETQKNVEISTLTTSKLMKCVVPVVAEKKEQTITVNCWRES